MKKQLAALLVAASIGLAVPANAQVIVNDPMVNTTLQTLVANQVKDANGFSARALKEMASEQHLLEQVKQMNLDHLDVSTIFKQLGPALTASIKTNNDLMTKTTTNDQSMTAEFKRLVPSFKAGDNYLEHVNTLAKNSFSAYAQALGVANGSVADESVIAAKVEQLDNAPPANQLQALNQMVTIGKMQVQQMDKLIKIQAAMMKSMSVSWQTQLASAGNGAGGTFNSANATGQKAIEYCHATMPFFGTMSIGAQRDALAKCQADLAAHQQTP